VNGREKKRKEREGERRERGKKRGGREEGSVKPKARNVVAIVCP